MYVKIVCLFACVFVCVCVYVSACVYVCSNATHKLKQLTPFSVY